MPGYIDPKFRDGAKKHSVWNTIKAALLLIGAALAVGAFAIFYFLTEMLPSLNH